MTDTFTYREPGKVVQDILQAQLSLTDSQVIFTNEKWMIPTKGVLVVVSYLGPGKIICNTDEMLPDGSGGQMEVQNVTTLDLIEIQVLGYNTQDVRLARNLVQMAFHSINSQQLQEQWNMSIAKHLGPMLDTSFLEGTSMITRYTSTIQVTSINQHIPAAPSYYDTFTIPPPVTINA